MIHVRENIVAREIYMKLMVILKILQMKIFQILIIKKLNSFRIILILNKMILPLLIGTALNTSNIVIDVTRHDAIFTIGNRSGQIYFPSFVPDEDNYFPGFFKGRFVNTSYDSYVTYATENDHIVVTVMFPPRSFNISFWPRTYGDYDIYFNETNGQVKTIYTNYLYEINTTKHITKTVLGFKDHELITIDMWDLGLIFMIFSLFCLLML